jgi:hypothetical protein
MGEKYIKLENGKEVVYEKGIFRDTKIGELENNFLSLSKETRNIFGEKVKVEAQDFLSDERKATVGKQEGVFRKDFLDEYPTFKPKSGGTGGTEKDLIPSTSGGSYGGGGGGESFGGKGLGCLVTALLLIAGFSLLSLSGILKRQEVTYKKPQEVYQTSVKPKVSLKKRKKTKESQLEKKLGNKMPFSKNRFHKKQYAEKNEVNEDIYKSLNPNSEFSRATPPEMRPVIKEIKNEKTGVVTRTKEYVSQKELREVKLSEIGMIYPASGNYYLISREKYPEFYNILDRNKDGKIDLNEMGRVQDLFSKITHKYPEGDLDSVIRDFLFELKKNN